MIQISEIQRRQRHIQYTGESVNINMTFLAYGDAGICMLLVLLDRKV